MVGAKGAAGVSTEKLMKMLEEQQNNDKLNDDDTAAAGDDGADVDPDDEQTILEEYKLWRKNCRYMYSFISETALTWPSLSIQFVKSKTFENKMKDTKFATTRNLLVSTYSSGNEADEYLKIASLQIPKSITEGTEMTSEELETVNSRLKISKKFKQGSEINKIRINPIDNHVIATFNASGQIFVYELDSKMNVIKEVELVHHKENGFGLCWNPHNQFQLLSSAEDKTVAFWDYSKSTTPIKVFSDHSNYVNDVRFSYKNDAIFGSIGEDNKFILRDLNKDTVLLNHDIDNISTTFSTFAFSPYNEDLVVFGGDDSNVYLYSLSNMQDCLHTLVGHQKSITNIEWDPFHDNIIGSSSLDRRVILWDLTKIGDEQLPDELDDGVPELLMMHGGHTGGVSDFAFNQEVEWCLTSCSDDNIVHVWVVKDDIVGDWEEVIDDNVVE